MRGTGLKAASGFLLVLAASSTSGAFLSRFLAENLYHRLTIFYDWIPTILLIAAVTLLMVLPRLLLSRRDSGTDMPLGDVLSYLPLLLLALYLFQRHVNTVQASVLLTGSLLLVVSLEMGKFLGEKWLDRSLLATLFLLPLMLYLMTLAPTVGEHDTFEFQVLSHELGIAHPTGYPLYILLGKLFTLLPLGDMAYRVNLSSALFAATTVVVLYGVIYDLTRRRSASALAALTFGFSYSFWSQAVVAEVYALNALFVALTCYLLLRCFCQTSIASQDSHPKINQRMPLFQRPVSDILAERQVLIYAAAFTYGLSLTHHRTMLLLAPAIIVYVLLNKPRSPIGLPHVVPLCIAFCAPLVAVHLYIPLRWWQIHGQIMTWSEFSNLVLGTQFAAALRWDAWAHEAGRTLIYLRTLLEQYPLPALGLALLGFIWLLWPKKSPHRHPGWTEGLFLLTAFIAYLLFGLSYRVPDVSLFLIPSHLLIAIGLGIGIALLCQLTQEVLARLAELTQPTRTRLVRAATLTLFGVLAMSLVWNNIPRVDRSDEYAWYDWGRYVLQQELPPGAVILADSEKIAPLYYLQRVEGLRPDTETGVFPDEESNRVEMDRRLSEGRPVFLARFLPGLERTYHLRSLGPLVEVSPYVLTELPSDLHRLENIGFEIPDSASKILLRGYRLDSTDLMTTDLLRITLYWQANEPASQNYEVRLRLVSPQGHVWYQTKGRSPVNGLYPTAAWRPGEIVPDFHQLDPAGNVPPGRYVLQAGLFTPFSRDGLVLPDTEEDYLSLAQVSISPAAAWSPAMQHSSRMNFNNQIMLLGYDSPGTVKPGGQATLTFYWQRISQVSADYDLTLELAGVSGDTPWRTIEPLLFGEYPTSGWPVGQLVADTHQIMIPVTATGELEVRIGLQDSQDAQPLPVASGWLAGWQNQSLLTRFQIRDLPLTPREENLPANFESRVSLLDYELHNVQVRQGEALQLTLTWQGLASMNEDYTVFVHLLDENEQIWGQEDIQPVYGTHPTSQWQEGEIITDPHTLWTDASSPLGLYRIEVGLYLLRTMERLQILDASGNAISNRVLLGWVEIVP
jgi:hypothetical protein